LKDSRALVQDGWGVMLQVDGDTVEIEWDIDHAGRKRSKKS